ncbi:MAG: ketoacyl-ACP synthase III [Phycisphaerae bacterium]|nr:ketoacyl-ACP synthase III [Phycisphaerae bacterium]
MPSPLGIRITGTGHAVPDRILTNADFVRMVDTTDEWIRERTGILERRIVGDGESTATLATDAARRAIENARLTAKDIDAIIVATITPECPFPATASFVQHAIGAPEIPCFDVCAACSGFIYGLVVASNLLHSPAFSNILLIGAETLSRITDYQDRTSCILFGDGAGAVVLTRTQNGGSSALLNWRLHSDGSGANMLWVPAGGSRLPASQMTINERLHYMKMQGREVYKFAVKRMLEMVEQTVHEAGVRPSELAMIIPHQSNKRIIESARQKLNVPESKMYTNIERFGNTSAASIPIGLDEVRRDGRVRDGDLVLLVAFGAGLTWASALLRL